GLRHADGRFLAGRARPTLPFALAAVAPARAHPEAHRRAHAVLPAEVAAPARRRIGVAEVAAEGDAPALLLVGVLDHRAQPTRVLAPQHLEAAAQPRDPLDERLQRHRRVDAAALD